MTTVPRTPVSDVEIEWQFDALDLRPVERWLAAARDEATAAPTAGAGEQPIGGSRDRLGGLTMRSKPAKRLVDTYLDTGDWRVSRAGLVLRIRRRAGSEQPAPVDAIGGEVTLKDRSPAVAGLRQRLEVTEPLPSGGLRALGPDGPVGRRLHALAGGRPLEQLFEVRTRRRTFELHAGDQAVGELALDDTVIDVAGGGKPLRMQRVEVEVQPSFVARLAPMVERLRAECGLQPAAVSKFEAGLLGSGLVVPPAPDLGPTTLSPVPGIAELAFVVLRRHLGAMLDHEPGTRLGEDPEELHDMRVATRRMRAALDLFSEVLPARATNVRAELGWVADALGRVRDLDVQLERIEQSAASPTSPQTSSALKELAELLTHRRSEARAALLACLDSARYDRLVASFAAMLRRGPLRRPAPANAPAVLAAPDLVRARHRAVAKAAKAARRSGNLDDFHKLRIRGKRLRYAVEFVSELYGSHARRYVRAVVELQDVLGSMQDARVAVEQLHSLAVVEDGGLSRETVFVLGGLAERFRQEAGTLAAEVPRHLAVLSGKRWDRLTAAMDQQRLEAAQLSGWPGTHRARPAVTPVVAQPGQSTGAPVPPPPTPEPAAAPAPGEPGPGSAPTTAPAAPATPTAPATPVAPAPDIGR